MNKLNPFRLSMNGQQNFVQLYKLPFGARGLLHLHRDHVQAFSVTRGRMPSFFDVHLMLYWLVAFLLQPIIY
jgi:hypothetical protein